MISKIFMLILCAINIHPGQRCRLNSRAHFGQPLPIMIRNERLLEPTDNDGNVDLRHGDVITISCEPSGFINHPSAIRQLETADIICDGEIYFKNDDWLNGTAAFYLFKCVDPPNYSSRRTDRSCYGNNDIIEVGYMVQNNFYPLYESCFDERSLNAIYSKYTQKPYNALYQTRVERPYFIDDNNYYGTIPVNNLFSPPSQKHAVAQLVGSAVEHYFTNDQHLSRGHLAAKTDFVFAFGERATFHYVNCAPQWTGFNGGNWNTLEVDLRNHIHNAGYDTIIYTGTYGVSQLFNANGMRVDIHLNTDMNNNPVIPVPKYFYKVVHEVNSKRGISFIGINNPYYTANEARSLFFCRDVCRNNTQFQWLSWDPNDPAKGYTFCCTVEDFANTVRHLPHFTVEGLLT